MSKMIVTTARNLRASDHFWYAGKFHLAHNVWKTEDHVQVETGTSSLFLRANATVHIRIPD